MIFREFFMLGFWGQVYRRRGVEVEYGNDGFPGGLWLPGIRGCRQSLVDECLHNDELKYGLEVALDSLRLMQHVCKMQWTARETKCGAFVTVLTGRRSPRS